MDKETRNLIFNTTQAVRRLLAEEFALQLEGTFDVHRDGQVAAQPGAQLTPAERLIRQRIVDAIMHRRAGGESDFDSVRGFQSEAVFTFVNRLAALKMMEARQLVLPCVSQGDQSQGFREFSGLAPGLIELPDKGYRLYLECLFDEIGREVGVLFDRTDAASQLWPRRNALESALEKLNNPELKNVWAEDETIGWIYQYYNDPEERKQMRDESAAPRNSRELAVRNQFFTPRYVVEFLTDNTLGRIWYDMSGGRTVLKEKCRYLVRCPNEIFLKPGETVPEQPKQDNLSQDELLRQTVFVPHRPLKDPRTILMLDPACGSMHFGLYAFDLFEVIYREAWEFEEQLGADTFIRPPGMKSLRESFATKEEFLRQVPKLIIEHNIHGIDIDPRAAQIAGLALWLRAQRSWKAMGLKPAERPAIKKSNIVCAEPMPGEKELLREFVTQKFSVAEQPVFHALLEAVFEKMKLAGEAGSLLKIEEEIRSAIEASKKLWKAGPKLEQSNLFADPGPAKQKELTIDLSGITDEDFWNTVESRIYAALREYAEQSESSGGFQRRLFAEDAARGFAFIDVCRKRYDVALMNPPFGSSAKSAVKYLAAQYPLASVDLYSMFVSRMLETSIGNGIIGAITSRTAFYSTDFEQYRETTLRKLSLLSCVADLGDGVLDAAVVETAAYCLTPAAPSRSTPFISCLSDRDKQAALHESLASLQTGQACNDRLFLKETLRFSTIPCIPMAYWLPDDLFTMFSRFKTTRDEGITVKQGLATGDDPRFLRLWWEVEPKAMKVKWFLYAKGGEYAPVHEDLHLVVLWESSGAQIINFTDEDGNQYSRPRGGDYYMRPGLTYSMRTRSSFSPRVMPAGCIFSVPGHAIFADASNHLLIYTGIAYTRIFRELLDVCLGGGEARCYYPTVLHNMPLPPFDALVNLEGLVKQWCIGIRSASVCEENNVLFLGLNIERRRSLLENARINRNILLHQYCEIILLFSAIENYVETGFALSQNDLAYIEAQQGQKLGGLPDLKQENAKSLNDYWNLGDHEILGHAGDSLGFKRFVTKKNYVASRKLEALCLLLNCNPLSVIAQLETCEPTAVEVSELTVNIVSIAVGISFGRWDIHRVLRPDQALLPDDPFKELPVCPPGQLQNAQGLPARPEDVPTDYPIKKIPWDGILVDDPNHPLDIERRVNDVIEIIWQDRAEAIEQEACEILGVDSLRDFFRKPACFFADHLSRYSKSRRQAPIYWPLSSPNNRYTVWLYYHRLNSDTLFTVLRDHVKPKLEYEERRAFEIRQDAGPSPSASQIRDIAEAEELVEDLRAFKAELERVAPLFRPNLNDGVIINYAPLWRLISLPKWRKDCQAVWNELAKGDYDWAHLALHLWPERVVPQCATDRSLAIAHGLNEFFWEEILGEAVDSSKPATKKKIKAAKSGDAKMTPPLGELAPEPATSATTTVPSDPVSKPVGTGKWRPKKVPAAEVAKLIAERTSPAVKAALESLVSAGTGAVGGGKKSKVANIKKSKETELL